MKKACKRFLLSITSVGLMSIYGCGGGGSGSSSTSVGVASGVATSSTTRIAQMEMLGASPDKMIASSSGIYGLQRGSPDKVRKWQRTPGAVGWLTYTLPTTSSVFAPLQLVNDEGISVHWAGFRSSDVRQIYDYLNAAEIDDIGINVLVTSGGTAGRHWAITTGGVVWVKSSGGGLGRNAVNTFTKVATTGNSYLGEAAAISDSSGTLYAASGSTLVRVTMSGSVSRWDMPSNINTLVSALGTVWVGAGSTIYRITGSSIGTYAQVPNILGLQAPIFCISNLDMYTANGNVIKGIDSSTAAPTAQSFISTSATTSASASDLTLMTQAKSGMMSSGVFCADNVDEFVFTSVVDFTNPAAGLQLMKIRPL